MRVVLGVSGSIAAYKAVNLVRIFRNFGHEVVVIPTNSALRFVGEPTWEALSGHSVSADVFSDISGVRHVALGQQAELVVVAPATADLLARMAAGQANDLLTNTLLTTQAPILVAPAMHTQMWQHPATVANIATLRQRGIIVLDPAVGPLTGSDVGAGRLPEPEEIYNAAVSVVNAGMPAVLAGKKVVVTAGGTREAIDPVRFIGNRSSGKQGISVAEAAVRAGAEVCLIAAHVDVALPETAGNLTVQRVSSAEELREAVFCVAPQADIVIMAAAVADFRPARAAKTKIKKDNGGQEVTITFERTPDILSELVQRRSVAGAGVPFLVGFAAETGDKDQPVREYAFTKLQRKGCDMLVVNDVSEGQVFGADTNRIILFDRSTTAAEAARLPEISGTKTEVSGKIVAAIADRLSDGVS